MIEAISYENMINDLSERYKGINKTFAILLVRPNRSVASEDILNDIQYFHHRSSNKLDIYMPGYGAYWGEEVPDSIDVCKVGDTKWSFSHGRFIEFIEKMENVSKWKYYGGTELILLDFQEQHISYKSVVRVKLDFALRDGAIDSVSEFIEKVIRIFIGNINAFSASDNLTLNELGRSISQEMKERFSLYRIFRRSRHYTIYSYEIKK